MVGAAEKVKDHSGPNFLCTHINNTCGGESVVEGYEGEKMTVQCRACSARTKI